MISIGDDYFTYINSKDYPSTEETSKAAEIAVSKVEKDNYGIVVVITDRLEDVPKGVIYNYYSEGTFTTDIFGDNVFDDNVEELSSRLMYIVTDNVEKYIKGIKDLLQEIC